MPHTQSLNFDALGFEFGIPGIQLGQQGFGTLSARSAVLSFRPSERGRYAAKSKNGYGEHKDGVHRHRLLHEWAGYAPLKIKAPLTKGEPSSRGLVEGSVAPTTPLSLNMKPRPTRLIAAAVTIHSAALAIVSVAIVSVAGTVPA